jgi:glycosyltransferase involved in cell wall biosynthesis
MRILLTADPIIPVPPVGYGGIERIVDGLLRQFRSNGHDVGLLAHPASAASADARFAWPALQVRGAWPTVRNALAMRRAVRRFKPDVVHSFSRLAYLAPLLRSNQPMVMSYQRHTGGRQISSAARIAGNKLQFTGCSKFISDMGRRAGGSWTAVPNFIEPEAFTFVPSVAADAPLVFLSRVEDMKGPDIAIEIARASGRRLIIAGNRADAGPQRAFFDRKIAPAIGRSGIEWIGEVNDEQKKRVLGQALALVVPIQWDEPFGIVFAEALACGTPVITCPRGAAPDIVRDGQTGFLVRDVREGAAAVQRLGSIQRGRCRDDVEHRYSVREVARQYLTVYRASVDSASR